MIKIADELLVGSPEPEARDKILSGLRRAGVFGLGAGLGAGAGTLVAKYLGDKIPDAVKSKYMPLALGLGSGAMLMLNEARMNKQMELDEQELNQKILLRMSEPNNEEAERIRSIVTKEYPEGSRTSVYLDQTGKPVGEYQKEIFLQPGLSAAKIRSSIWRD